MVDALLLRGFLREEDARMHAVPLQETAAIGTGGVASSDDTRQVPLMIHSR